MKFFSLEMSDMTAISYNSSGLYKLRQMTIYDNDAAGFAEVNALYGQKCAEEYKQTGVWTCK